MNCFPSFFELIKPKDMAVSISPEKEQKIIDRMEAVQLEIKKEEALACKSASNLVLNC